MLRSLWTGASGMIGQQFNIDTISNNLANVNNNQSNLSIPTIKFSMASNVFGRLEKSLNYTQLPAFFSEWRCIEDHNGLFAKQSSSAITGDLIKSIRLNFTTSGTSSSTESSEISVLYFQDSIKFDGLSFNDRVNYLNKGDAVRNSFTSRNISKNSIYFGGFEDHQLDDDNVSFSSFNKTTIYRLGTRNNGTIKLDLVSSPNDNYSRNNSPVISEEYTGEIAMDINFNNSLRSISKKNYYPWLPCCNTSSDAGKQDQEYFDIAAIFDSTSRNDA